MAPSFIETTRSIQADNFRISLVGLALGWLSWMFFANVTVYEIRNRN
jgi:hypothetical protein